MMTETTPHGNNVLVHTHQYVLKEQQNKRKTFNENNFTSK